MMLASAAAPLILLALLPYAALAWPSGAPAGACSVLTPNHGAAAQTSDSPFSLDVRPRYGNDSDANKEGQVLVSLLGKPRHQFKGFLIQGRDPDTNEVIGSFVIDRRVEAQNGKALQCNLGRSDSVTHSDNSRRNKFEVYWQPPANATKVKFVATAVQEKLKFWTGLESEVIELTPGAGGAATTASALGLVFTLLVAAVSRFLLH